MPVIEREHVRIHYVLSGAPEGAVLVLVNSLGSDLRMWDQVLPELEGRYRVLRYDIRGHGRSSAVPGPYSIRQLGEDLLLLLDDLRLSVVNICGLSLGGLIAMWVGIHTPERVRRIVLANTAARIGTTEAWEQRIAEVHSTGMLPLADATPERWFTPGYRDHHVAEMEFIRSMIASTDAHSYAACCEVLRDTDLRSEIGTIEAPCLVITGTHDTATPPSDGQALCVAHRDSIYVELEASHLSAWERAKEFGEAVGSFLEKEEVRNG